MNAFSEMLLGTKKQAESVQPQVSVLDQPMPSFVCEPTELELIPLKQFVLAGKAAFNLFDDKTGEHHTYRVNRAEKPKTDSRYDRRGFDTQDKPDMWFVNLGIRYGDTVYLGLLQAEDDGQIQFRLTKKSRYQDQLDPIPNLFIRFWNALRVGESPQETQQIRFEHAGLCCVCARELTDPVSVARGIGPICEAGGGY